QEQRKIADVATTVKIPSGAPRIQYWYVEREAVVSEACDRLGVGNSTSVSSEELRMVGLAGPSGVGKSTAAAMVAGRADVRAHFHKGVLWLQNDPEDGAAYIREVDEKSRRFLVVADDVWEREVLEELKRAGVMWVLYTTRQDTLLPEQAPQRLDEMLPKEAELVLRRAADLDDNARLPEAAYDLMNRCESVVLDLAMVGRWGLVRRRRDEKAWRMALNRIVEAQKGGGDERVLSWRAAVLRAGLEELASDNPQNKELYLSLAVIPKGLSFPREVAAVLLYGDDLSAQDLEAAEAVMTTLERWSILTVEDGSLHRIHDEHAEFIEGRLAANQDARISAQSRWRGYASSDVPLRPYDAALNALDPSSAAYANTLKRAALFHMQRQDWSECRIKYSNLLTVKESAAGMDHLDVAITMENYGVCAHEEGRMKEAEALNRRVLAIREEKLGVDHPDVAHTLRNLGVCAHKIGRMEEAEDFHRRALAIREEKLGVDHPDEGRMEQAEDFHRRALAIREEKLGVDHPDVARTLNGLGNCASKVGRTEEAEDFHRRALAILEEKLGVDHPDVARTLNDLGNCASKVGRTEEAEDIHRRALAILEKKLGVDHPDVARTLNGLGVCAHKIGRMEEAEDFHRRALAILEEKLGELHRRELAIREEKLGENHPDVADTLHWLAVNVGDAGRKEEAEKLFRQALAIRDEKLGVDHWDTAITRKALAELHKSTLAVVTQAVAVLLAGVVLYVTKSARYRGEQTVVNGFS
ncbi:unnamed protein product, partial [Ectocarpus sp. 6 AP-2014]